MPSLKLCAIPNCAKPAFRREWCSSHWHRWQRYGEPTASGPLSGKAPRFIKNVALNYCGDDCLTWPFARDRGGYGVIQINGKPQGVHRVVCEMYRGPAPTPDHEAAHECGKGHAGCCNPQHLFWKTCAENSADRLRHGTHSRGTKNGRVKLTEENVRSIRAFAGTMRQCDIGERFGVSQQVVSSIINRKGWSWLP
jgi:hypothetical protein